MPDLPTFTVSDAQADRLMKAFGTPAAYKAWLKGQITEVVKRYESKEKSRLMREYAESLDVPGTDPLDGAK